MIIEEPKFMRTKIVNEIKDLMKNNRITWRTIEIGKDYMTNVNYKDSKVNKLIPISYRVCCYNKKATIIAYDMSVKKRDEEIPTTDIPNIEIDDDAPKGEIYNLLEEIKEFIKTNTEEAEQKFLDKLTICLNTKK